MILKLLKDVTRESHLALERQMPLLDAELRLDTYRHMVQKLFTYHKPLEATLLASSGYAELGVAYTERAKTARLAHDLSALGLSTRDIEQLRVCKSLPPLADPSHIFGCLYVLEGATLGGQIVNRHLQASLGLTADSGASYFSGYGVDTGPRWKAFCAILTAYAERTDDQNDIVAGANATYATLSAWMRAGDGERAHAPGAQTSTQPALA
ncbi:MAG: biliverdin-producing heme oxygenase [Gemmatimonadaceae bacterium]|nr:biliverdin-producing heme oxygenase [Gemmatimonadaceae bacterium]